MKILTEIKDSIYNPSYYKALPTSHSLKDSIKYLAKLSLLVALVSAILITPGIPRFYKAIKNAVISIGNEIPDDLVLSIKDGKASINQPEPFVIPTESILKDTSEKEKFSYANLVVVDTTKDFSVEQFKTYSSLIWITKKEIAIVRNTDREEVQIAPLGKNLEITKPWILEKQTFLLKILPWLVPMVMLVLYSIFFSVNFFGTLIVTLLYAFIIWLISKIKKVELFYKNSYKIGIHAATLLIIFSEINVYLRIPFNFLIKVLIIIVLVYINFFRNTEAAEQKMPY